MVVLTDENIGAVEEAFEWSCSAATEYFDKGSCWKNCTLSAVYLYAVDTLKKDGISINFLLNCVFVLS